MRKKTLFLLVSIPITAFSQSPVLNSGSGFMSFLLALAVCIILFLLCREILCWYWKINKMVSNQEEIIRLLRKIADESNAPVNDKKLGEEKRNILKN